MSKFYVQVVISRLETQYSVKCIAGPMKVSYRERPSKQVNFNHTVERTVGGGLQKATVGITVECSEDIGSCTVALEDLPEPTDGTGYPRLPVFPSPRRTSRSLSRNLRSLHVCDTRPCVTPVSPSPRLPVSPFAVSNLRTTSLVCTGPGAEVQDAVKKGILAACSRGVRYGYPIMSTTVRVTSLEHEQDTSLGILALCDNLRH